MRITGGQFKGRRINAAKGDVSRPTTDRTRESLFNILAHDKSLSLEGAKVIDCFAGSGALGFEAISRGAASCLFIEQDASARGAIRNNIEALGLFGVMRILRRSALALGKLPANAGGPFNLAFLDPPYRKDFAPRAMQSLVQGGWLEEEAMIIVEQAKDEDAIDLPNFKIRDHRTYGDTRISFFIYHINE